MRIDDGDFVTPSNGSGNYAVSRGIALDYSDVLLVPTASEFSSRSQINLAQPTPLFPHPVVPIIAANMDGVGTFEMGEALAKHNMVTAIHKHYELRELLAYFQEYNDNSIYCMGISDDDFSKFKKFYKYFPKLHVVCIDVANGYMNKLIDIVKQFKEDYPEVKLIVGNVVTQAGAKRLFNVGVESVKVGIGSGSVCTTRTMTGVGFPQFTAVQLCSALVAEYGTGHEIDHCVIADGGCTTPGDIAKAFVAGADFVMLGGMLAGHNEGMKEQQQLAGGVEFYGMSSSVAMKKHSGGVADYRSSEGRVVKIPFRGAVDDTVAKILGGLRSTCTYLNSRNPHELRYESYVRVNNQLNRVYENTTVGY